MSQICARSARKFSNLHLFFARSRYILALNKLVAKNIAFWEDKCARSARNFFICVQIFRGRFSKGGAIATIALDYLHQSPNVGPHYQVSLILFLHLNSINLWVRYYNNSSLFRFHSKNSLSISYLKMLIGDLLHSILNH